MASLSSAAADPRDDCDAFYGPLIGTSYPLVVRATATKGKSGFARAKIQEGSVCFAEKPLVCLQSLQNRFDVPTCSRCHVHVGDVEEQVDLLARRVTPAEYAAHRAGWRISDRKVSDANNSIFSCKAGCGILYCSNTCLDAHWTEGHCFLCTGPCNDDHPLVEFKRHAIQTNEIFLLAATVVGKIYARYLELLDTPAITENRNVDVNAASGAKCDFIRFVANPWWSVAWPENSSDPEEKRHLEKTLYELATESFNLLRLSFLAQTGRNADAWDTLFNVEYYGCIIGMFEQNNLGVQVHSPIMNTLRAVSDSEGNLPSEIMNILEPVLEEIEEIGFWEEGNAEDVHSHDGHTHGQEEEEDEDDTEGHEEEVAEEAFAVAVEDLRQYFPPLDGTALFSVICCLNHSCAPNVRVEWSPPGEEAFHNFDQKNEALQAKIVALRDIEEGEELCFSYIDTSLPIHERRMKLRDYGFLCECARCLSEQ